MTEQRDFFREVEREYWAGAEGLKEEEAALIERYLDPALATLDAGTGGGRLARGLADAGFADLTGFDYAPELIEAARAADAKGRIRFDVADATALPYPDGSFRQALYLQQVIATIEDATGRVAALAEAARVLAPGGTALFSFVCLESRFESAPERAYVAYLRAVRRLRRDRRPIQSMPRLRLSGRLSATALRDRGPYNWWYRAEEAEAALAAVGLEPAGVMFGPQLVAGQEYTTAAAALAAGPGGTLYLAAKKS